MSKTRKMNQNWVAAMALGAAMSVSVPAFAASNEASPPIGNHSTDDAAKKKQQEALQKAADDAVTCV